MTGETDASKIIQLPSKVIAMVSGREGYYGRFLRKLAKNVKLGCSIPDTLTHCEKAYRETRSEIVGINYLQANLIDEKRLLEESLKPQPNKHVRDLMNSVSSFALDCSVMLCGFDESGKPFIITTSHPGEAVDDSRLGYSAIGIGSEYAIARLVCWSDWDRKKPLDQALYSALDAKISAESNPFIGGDWNASVVLKDSYHELDEKTMDLLDKGWVRHNRSPYWKRAKDDLDDPPDDWIDQMKAYAESIIPSDSPTDTDVA